VNGNEGPIASSAPMKYCNFVISGFSQNSCFSKNARDGCASPFIALRDKFLIHGVELNTPDLNVGKEVLFEIHIDVHTRASVERPVFILLFETVAVALRNQHIDPNEYQAIFSWNDDQVRDKKYHKFHLPVERPNVPDIKGFAERNSLCCAISMNKSMRFPTDLELYSRRVETYLWFERNAPQDFDLYGMGWENPPARSGTLGKIVSKFNKILPIKFSAFKHCYKGKAETKTAVLGNYKFSICYENFRGLNGQITEKIFDCMFSGCVPIYWGAENIGEYIPDDCFIDRRDFKDDATLYKFLKSVDANKFNNYQQSIKTFLDSDSAKKFYKENFVDTVSSVILNHLSLQ
jgi:alpha(1,3/1,4) fucosyltransferase